MDEESNDVTAQGATVEQTTDTESSTVEQATTEVKDDVATSEDTTEGEDTQTGESEEQVSDEKLAPKSQNRFQKLANEKRAAESRILELEQKISQLEQFDVPTEQDYIDGGYEPVEAKLNAMQAEMAQMKEISKVKALNASVEGDMVRIVHEFPQLDPSSPEFKEDLAVQLFTQYDQDAETQYADGGIVLQAKQLPYEYIKAKMNLIGLASKDASVKAQKSVERMVSVAETPTGKVSPKAPSQMTTKELEKTLGVVYQ